MNNKLLDLYLVILLTKLVSSLHNGTENNYNYYPTMDKGSISDEPGCKLLDNNTLRCEYVPKEMAPGIVKVILNLRNESVGFDLDTKVSKTNWRRARHLEVYSDSDDIHVKNHSISILFSFEGLGGIEEKKVRTKQVFAFRERAFFGLKKLKSLNLKGCYRLHFHDLIFALQDKNSAPNLETLIISGVSLYVQTYISKWNSTFFDMLASKKIRILDASFTSIVLDVDAFAEFCSKSHLENLNVSRSSIVFARYSLPLPNICPSLKELIANFSIFSVDWKTWGPEVFKNLSKTIPIEKALIFARTEEIHLKAVMPKSVVASENTNTSLRTNYPLTVKRLFLSGNSFARLDLSISCRKPTLQHLDSFKYEKFPDNCLSCGITLKNFDISSIAMYREVMTKSSPIEQLFETLVGLKFINVMENKENVSSSSLQQLDFNIEYLSKLQLLDLTQNKIEKLHVSSNFRIEIESYPSGCSNSGAYLFIKFVVDLERRSHQSDHLGYYASCIIRRIRKYPMFYDWRSHMQNSNLTCGFEDSNATINSAVIKSLKHICDNSMYIRNVVALTTLIPWLSLLLLIVLWKYRKHWKKKRNLEERYDLLSLNDTYTVFLSFCYQDEDFVKSYVLSQLNDHLAQRLSDNRELVCYGDKHFRVGRRIANEEIRLMERSNVMLVIVSENYCKSLYCQREFEVARDVRIPIMLMFKEEVDKNLMCPEMRTMYRENTRILWTQENGEYVLKTTWENISDSIVMHANPRTATYRAN